jgi:hypothetical protein
MVRAKLIYKNSKSDLRLKSLWFRLVWESKYCFIACDFTWRLSKYYRMLNSNQRCTHSVCKLPLKLIIDAY